MASASSLPSSVSPTWLSPVTHTHFHTFWSSRLWADHSPVWRPLPDSMSIAALTLFPHLFYFPALQVGTKLPFPCSCAVGLPLSSIWPCFHPQARGSMGAHTPVSFPTEPSPFVLWVPSDSEMRSFNITFPVHRPLPATQWEQNKFLLNKCVTDFSKISHFKVYISMIVCARFLRINYYSCNKKLIKAVNFTFQLWVIPEACRK